MFSVVSVTSFLLHLYVFFPVENRTQTLPGCDFENSQHESMSDPAEANRSLTSDFWREAELHLHWRVQKTLSCCFQLALHKIITCILCSTCCFTASVKRSGVYHWKRLTCVFQHGKETYQNVLCLNLIIFPISICLGSQLIAGQAHKVKNSFAQVSPQLNSVKKVFRVLAQGARVFFLLPAKVTFRWSPVHFYFP